MLYAKCEMLYAFCEMRYALIVDNDAFLVDWRQVTGLAFTCVNVLTVCCPWGQLGPPPPPRMPKFVIFLLVGIGTSISNTAIYLCLIYI